MPEAISRELLVVVTTGQSLSVGVTKFSEYEPLWTEPVDADRAFMLDFGNNALVDHLGWGTRDVDTGAFEGFKPLQSSRTETPATGMVSQILKGYDDAGVVSPDIVHMHAGKGGASILKLMSTRDDIYGDIAAGLASTADGGIFLVPKPGGDHSYYINDDGAALFVKSIDGDPTAFDAVAPQFGLIASEAETLGYALPTRLAVAFIHGQSDTNIDYGIYTRLIRSYIDRLEQTAEDAWGGDVEVVASVSQQRGYGAGRVPLQQLDAIIEDPDIHFGAPEILFETRYPSVPGNDVTHLSPEGYLMMGQTIGARMYDALIGAEDLPILIDTVTRTDAQELTITFSGVEGDLVSDSSDFLPEMGYNEPEYFGFGLYNANGGTSGEIPRITGAWITGAAEVTLSFETDITGDWRLYLGRNERTLSNGIYDDRIGGTGWHANTLRDSETDTLHVSPKGLPFGAGPIREFAPFQYADLSFEPFEDPGMTPEAIDVLVQTFLDIGMDRRDGTDGRDTLKAAREGSVLLAGPGKDRLIEKKGSDVMVGGADDDTFVFDLRKFDNPQTDVIADLNFEEGDRIIVRTRSDGYFDGDPDPNNPLFVGKNGNSTYIDSLADLSELVAMGVMSVAPGELVDGLRLIFDIVPDRTLELAFYDVSDLPAF